MGMATVLKHWGQGVKADLQQSGKNVADLGFEIFLPVPHA
jgi:hypothetical protein